MARPSQSAVARRLLSLIHLLSESHTRIPLEQIAKTFNISLEEARRDVERLALCGIDDDQRINIFTSADQAVIWGELPALERPLRLCPSESRALIAALDAAGIGSTDPLRIKLLEAASSAHFTEDYVSHLVTTGVSSEVGNLLKKITEAHDKNVALTIWYAAFGSEEVTERLIEVYQLFNDHDAWYVEAWCHKAQGMRTFKVDRIKDARLTDVLASPHELLLQPQSSEKNRKVTFALLKVHDASVLEEHTWPGLELIESSESFFASTQAGLGLVESPKSCSTVKQEEDLFVRIPYISSHWLIRQVRASLGALEVIAPQALRDQLAQEHSETQANLQRK